MSAELDRQRTEDTDDGVTIAGPRRIPDRMRRIQRRQELTLDCLAQAMPQFRGRVSELVLPMTGLRDAEEGPDTTLAVAAKLAVLGTRAEAALHSGREIGRGVYPPVLAGFGISEALRAQAARGSLKVRVIGTVPRRTLTARAEDNGRGYDPTHTREGAGLRNIRDRISAPGGTVDLASRPGRGTVLTMRLPCRRRQSAAGRPTSANPSDPASVPLIEPHDRISDHSSLQSRFQPQT